MQRSLILASGGVLGGVAVWCSVLAPPVPDRGPGWAPRAPEERMQPAIAQLPGSDHDHVSLLGGGDPAKVEHDVAGGLGPAAQERRRPEASSSRLSEGQFADRHLAALWRAVRAQDDQADARAIRSLRALRELADRSSDGGLHRKLIGQLGRILGRRRDGRGLDGEAYAEAVSLLGGLGAPGTAALQRLIVSLQARPERDARTTASAATALRELGRARDPKQIDFLLQVATRSPDGALRAAAGLALGEFESSEGRVRWEIARRLIAKLVQLHWRVAYLADPTEQAILSAVREPWQKALSRVCRVERPNPPEWGRWWNQTGKSLDSAVWR